MTALVILGLIAWFAIGVIAGRAWWTYDHGSPPSGPYAPVYLVMGMLGPLSIIVGYLIHGR